MKISESGKYEINGSLIGGNPVSFSRVALKFDTVDALRRGWAEITRNRFAFVSVAFPASYVARMVKLAQKKKAAKVVAS